MIDAEAIMSGVNRYDLRPAEIGVDYIIKFQNPFGIDLAEISVIINETALNHIILSAICGENYGWI